MTKTVAIIPARYASTRLPGKLIKSEARVHTGKYLIEHVNRGEYIEGKDNYPHIDSFCYYIESSQILKPVAMLKGF
jgi:CMP-N-acetylneuraminic acid synthetase